MWLISLKKKSELEKKTPDINNLGPKMALTTVENKIPILINLVKKTDYNTKVTEIENKLTNHNYAKNSFFFLIYWKV